MSFINTFRPFKNIQILDMVQNDRVWHPWYRVTILVMMFFFFFAIQVSTSWPKLSRSDEIKLVRMFKNNPGATEALVDVENIESVKTEKGD